MEKKLNKIENIARRVMGICLFVVSSINILYKLDIISEAIAFSPFVVVFSLIGFVALLVSFIVFLIKRDLNDPYRH